MARSIVITGVLLLAFTGAISTGWFASAGEGIFRQGELYSDYPRRVPEEYIFRSGRFSVQPVQQQSLAGRAGKVKESDSRHGEELMARVGLLARQLLTSAEEEIASQYTVAVSSFVNLNNLYRTSALGRYVSEQMMGELQVAGVNVIELRRTPSIMISREHGEYAMSRDMNELAFTQYAHATLVGTYTVAEDQLFLNARLLRNRDSKVLASGSLVAALDPITRGLLADEDTPAAGNARVKIRSYRE